jgi:predicted transposase YbfD/YdcC
VPGSYECEDAYLISSLDLRRHTAEELLKFNRGHWGVENTLHYVRDMTMGEDACRVRTGSAPQILAGLRNSVIGLLKRAKCKNIAAALRHHAVHVSKALRMIGIAEN